MKRFFLFPIVFLSFYTIAVSQPNHYTLQLDRMLNESGVALYADEDGLILISDGRCRDFSGRGCPGIIKLTFSGEIIWETFFTDDTYLDTSPSSSNNLARDSKGNYYITGNRLFNNLEKEAWLAKVSAAGKVLWERYVENPELIDFGHCVRVSRNDEPVILASEKCLNADGKTKWMEEKLIIYDPEGQNQRIIPLPDAYQASFQGNLELLEEEDQYIVVYEAIPYTEDKKRPVLLKIDLKDTLNPIQLLAENFNKTWSIGETVRIKVLNSGDYIMGWYQDSIENDGVLLYRLNPGGEVIWKKPMLTGLNGGFTLLSNMVIAQNQDILGCGISLCDSIYYAWAFRVSSDGETLWEHCYYSPDYFIDPVLHDLVELPDGRIAYTGVIGDSLTGTDIWLLITDANGCVADDCGQNGLVTGIRPIIISHSEKYFQLLTNPVRETAEVVFAASAPLPDGGRLLLYDLQGRLLLRQAVARYRQRQRLEVGALLPGVYVLSLVREGRILQSERVVVH